MTASEDSWRGLHPASVLVNLIPMTWRTLRNAWPLLVLVFIQGSVQGVINLLLIFAFFGAGVARAVIHFATLRYRVHDGRLEIKNGLFARSHRTIDPARIQNVEIIQNIYQRMAGLVELHIETAGDRGVEGLLSAITTEEAESLRAALARHAPAPAVEEHDEVVHLGIVEVMGYGISAGRIGAAAVIVGLMADGMAQLSPQELQQATTHMAGATLGGLVLVSVAGAYLISVGNAILRYLGFKLYETKSGIAVESGLFTRRRVEIPRRKVQAVRVDEPWLRRFMGFATLHIDTAGSGLPPEAGGLSGEAVVPMVDAHDRLVVLDIALPGFDVDIWAAPLRPAAPRALIRQMISATIRWVLLGLMLRFFVGSWFAMLVLPWGWLAAWLDWRTQGWLVTPTHLISRRGFWRRQTWVVSRAKLQSLHQEQGPLMRANGLAQIVAWVAGDRIVLPEVRVADAEATFRELSPWANQGAQTSPVPAANVREPAAPE